MRFSFSLAVLLISASIFSCSDSQIHSGTTIVGNGGVISGYVNNADTATALQKKTIASSDTAGTIVYLLRDSLRIDSQQTKDSYFIFSKLSVGVYSVLAKNSNGWEAVITGIPIDSTNTKPIQVVLYPKPISMDTTNMVDTIFIQPSSSQAQDADIIFSLDSLNNPVASALSNMTQGLKDCAASGAYDHNTVFRSLLQFALPDSLNNWTIVSAQLILTPINWMAKSNKSAYTLAVHKLLKSWKQGSGTAVCGGTPTIANSASVDGVTALARDWSMDGSSNWNQVGVGLDDQDASQSIYALGSMNYGQTTPLILDVQSLVASWVSNPSSNFGMLLRNTSEFTGNYVSYPFFNSGEATDPSTRPALKIVVSHRATTASSSSNGLVSSSSVTPQMITIQPSPSNAEDATIYMAQDGTAGTLGNYNVGTSSCLGCGAYDASTVFRILIRFDLSGIPAGKTITKATLQLTPQSWVNKNDAVPYQIAVHQVLRSWKQGTGAMSCGSSPTQTNSATVDGATGVDRFYSTDGSGRWNLVGVGLDNVDADSTPAVLDTVATNQMSVISIEVTSLAQQWASDSSSNFGMLLRNPDEFTTKYPSYPLLNSAEASDSTTRPALVLEVQ